jgi:hypothetical protein
LGRASDNRQTSLTMRAWNIVGSAYRIRTGDLLLEREVS